MASIFSRTAAGTVAFASAGYLIQAILAGHGGTQQSQSDWRLARERSIAVSSSRRDDALPTSPIVADPVVTGSIGDAVPQPAPKSEPRTEPTVLSLIRDNADLVPGVSSGTDRVSITVKEGDTLFGIALRHGLKTRELAGLNGLKEPYVIKVGQTLYVAR